MANPPEIDSVLVERFAHGNGTVFVGAGISLGARLPSWGELMSHLRTDLGKEVGPSTDYLHIAELFETKHSRQVLVQYLKDRLGDVRFQLTRTHELIVGLPVQRIYTTNFDTLLEQASQKKQINRNVIFNTAHVGFSDTSTLSIVKLHGDLADPASIVISARDFYSYLARNPAVADLLKVELQTHTVLFLGYSFGDPNLAMILGNSVLQSGPSQPMLYSLQFNPTDVYIQAMRARGVKVIGLKVKPNTAEADQAVEDWLRAFKQNLVNFERRRHRFVRQDKHLHEQRLPLLRKNAVRRARMSDRIRTGLQSDFRVLIVKGEAGIGKTQLVADVAAESLYSGGAFMTDNAFERIIWIKASFDLERVGWVGHTLKGILDTIASNVDTLVISDGSDDLKKKRAEINLILQERRLLIVVEDFEDPRSDRAGNDASLDARVAAFEDIKEWLENAGPYANPMSRIIVTSRTAIVAGFVVEIAKLDKAEATELLQDHVRAIMLRSHKEPFGDQFEEQVLELTAMNPQAIKLALGLCNGIRNPAEAVIRLKQLFREKVELHRIEAVFDLLIAHILEEVERPSAVVGEIVTAMTIFPTEEWVPAELLEAAVEIPGTGDMNFATMAKRSVLFGLLEYSARKDEYLMPRIIKEVLIRNADNAASMTKARERLADYLLKFLKANICRGNVKEAYWDALVCDEMVRVDPWWQIIDVVMHWPDGGKRAIDFALLMVHYMDSRFLNNQRLKFIELALKDPAAIEPRTAAVLYIDGLAWTYMEEGGNQQARHAIDRGLELFPKNGPEVADEWDDLRALAYAWRARIDAAEGKKGAATRNIDLACRYVERLQEKPWIQLRVQMMAGDVKYMDDEPENAIEHYMKAAEHAEFYGGEGDGYQINPRIGLALLEVRDKDGKPDEQCLQKARRRFLQLIDNRDIPTGRLYGQYGMALIAVRENLTGEAQHQLQQIQQEIRHRSKGNVLLRMAEKSYEKIISSGSTLFD